MSPENFWNHTASEPGTGCLLWTASVRTTGYGQVRWRGKTTSAHRVAYEIVHGSPVPNGKVLCHTCDQRLCVNTDHLFVGTQADNLIDCVRKGRLRPHNRLKDRCIRGHVFDAANTIIIVRHGVVAGRACRECKLAWSREHKRQKRRTT
ncbi:MAG: HNH endonuclease signature motif containing protein [Gemmatimonadota bacterium]